MTEPILSGSDLRPLLQVLFARRGRTIGILLLGTVLSFVFLLWWRTPHYQSGAVVMVRVPMVSMEFQIDPNPQIAPAYLDLAGSDGLFSDTYSQLLEMRRIGRPIADELDIPAEVNFKDRENILPRLRKSPDLPGKLVQAASALPLDWQKELFIQPDFFLGLFEFNEDKLEQLPLFEMQKAFKVKTKIAEQTNITVTNQPFLNFNVRWKSPGASAVWANLWSRLFVDRTNDITKAIGAATEVSILEESSKIEGEVENLQKKQAHLRAQSEYQKMLLVRGMENTLYGGSSKIDMFGYIELHADIATQTGLMGDLGKLEFEAAAAVSAASAAITSGSNADETARLKREATLLLAQVEGTRDRIGTLAAEAKSLRAEVAEFNAQYEHLQFEIDHRNRIMAERSTTAIFANTRIKPGYTLPPMVFVERAIPAIQPVGIPHELLAVVFGILFALLYMAWVVYREYLVPAFKS